jgi:hypothetical protein
VTVEGFAMRKFVLVLPFAVACASAPPPEAAAPVAPQTAPAEKPAEPPPGKKPIAPAAVPPAPDSCTPFVRNPTTGCIPAGSSRELLAAALSRPAGPERDAALACLEESGDFPPGFLRALRAELAPDVCTDALAAPLLEKPPAKLAIDIEGALLGLVVSGRLSRLLGKPPELTPPFSKDRFLAFQRDQLGPWIVSQALAIDQLSLQGSRLSGYGRGIAAIAAGNADLRFVEMAREIPLPEELKKDKELTDVYYGALDEALEPRKQRGRDAALVGLKAFAELGALSDRRVEDARRLLSKLWSGSRVDALDELLLPPVLAESSFTAPEDRLAAVLPTFYAERVLADYDASESERLAAFSKRGIPKSVLARLDPKKLSAAARLALATIQVHLGRQYFRAGDFRRARATLGAGPLDGPGRLLDAIAQALEKGPEDTATLMLKGPSVKGSFDVSALDAIAKQKVPYAGLAAYDAAYILSLTPKPDDAAFWDDLGLRYENAERLLSAQKAVVTLAGRARKSAEAARATAKALRSKQ